MASPAPCCPPGSEPNRILSLEEPKGQMVDINGLQCYVARPAEGVAVTRGLILFADIFGYASGRHRQLCDQLAERGILVVNPDLFGEDMCVSVSSQFGMGPLTIIKFIWALAVGRLKRWSRRHSWEAQLKDAVMDKVVPWLKGQGAQKLATIGFCWGAYPVLRSSMTTEFACGVSFHPSAEGICQALGEDYLAFCRQVKCPQFIMATSMESKAVRPGGAAEAATREVQPETVWLMETDAAHGYMSRGDSSNAKTAAALERGMKELMTFLEKHLLN